MEDEITGIKEDLRRAADEEGDVLCRAALRHIEALEATLEMARGLTMAVGNHKSKIRPDNRPFHLLIDGELAGMFHSERQAKAARTAVRVAMEYRGRDVPDMQIVDFRSLDF